VRAGIAQIDLDPVPVPPLRTEASDQADVEHFAHRDGIADLCPARVTGDGFDLGGLDSTVNQAQLVLLEMGTTPRGGVGRTKEPRSAGTVMLPHGKGMAKRPELGARFAD